MRNINEGVKIEKLGKFSDVSRGVVIKFDFDKSQEQLCLREVKLRARFRSCTCKPDDAMEKSARRRLDCISRHLVLQPQANHGLQQVLLLSNGQVKSEEAEPVVIGGMVLDIHATPSIPANPEPLLQVNWNCMPNIVIVLFVSDSTFLNNFKLLEKFFCSNSLSLEYKMANESQMENCNFHVSLIEYLFACAYPWESSAQVSYVLGGVARNVAECISKLGAKPFMISALGLDMPGIWKHQNIETPVVCNVLDVSGELAAAVASVEAIVSSMAAECKIPVWFEPVSVAKSRRISSVVKSLVERVTFASPNEDELVAMANNLSGGNVYCPIERNNSRKKCSTETLFHMLKSAVWVLLEKGIKIVVVTVGSDGVFLCSRGGPSLKQYASNGELFNTVTASCPSNLFSSPPDSERSSFLFAVHFPALPASVVRLTGAGLDVMQSLAVGIAASKAAVEAETNVPSMTQDRYTRLPKLCSINQCLKTMELRIKLNRLSFLMVF
ncbi:pfkB-like carbohydrate kinase family protein [Prunus dulcis]|uniref:PfkB-like carbohydrate kinase family protein n=1 Tax=Prunus dulcis TaxID=3755 RepID=A0A4Y1S044_PRUDU|nr:pfkB-like carbohydrate kinase family protein [Prunus dulcis]